MLIYYNKIYFQNCQFQGNNNNNYYYKYNYNYTNNFFFFFRWSAPEQMLELSDLAFDELTDV